MGATTPRLALPYPIPDDAVDVPRDVQALAVKLDAIKNLGVPLVSVLPATAVEGDEVYFDANPAQGVIWHLRYDASIGDGNKWEFLGGAPIHTDVVASSTTNSTTFADLASGPGPSVVAPLKGLYNVEHGAQLTTSPSVAGNTAYQAYAAAGSGIVANDGMSVLVGANGVVNMSATMSRARQALLTVAGDTVVTKYRSSSTNPGVITANYRWIRIWPVRVGP
jgi:hypothetical protein